ncbi:hypothetical protein ABZ867_29360 [Streptomyces cinnamoneus]
MSSKKNTVRVDWKAPHGILTGTLNATAGTLVTTALAHSAGMPSGYALAAGAAGAVGSSVAGWRNRLTGATVAFRAACWTAAGTWSCWALSAGGPVTLTGLGSLLVGGMPLGRWRRGSRRTRRPNRPADACSCPSAPAGRSPRSGSSGSPGCAGWRT